MNKPFFEEEYQGFDIKVYVEDEDIAIEDTFNDSVDDIQDIYQKIITGRAVYFCAHVSASKCGVVLGDDYLCGCLYETYQAFVDAHDYYDDMRDNVVREAKKKIEELCK